MQNITGAFSVADNRHLCRN